MAKKAAAKKAPAKKAAGKGEFKTVTLFQSDGTVVIRSVQQVSVVLSAGPMPSDKKVTVTATVDFPANPVTRKVVAKILNVSDAQVGADFALAEQLPSPPASPNIWKGDMTTSLPAGAYLAEVTATSTHTIVTTSSKSRAFSNP